MLTEMQHLRVVLFVPAMLFLTISCEPEARADLIVTGLRPVYAASDAWQRVSLEGPREIQHLGKLAMKDAMLFVNERNAGIHIINNADSVNPVPIGFLNIPGNTDFDFKGDVLYADNYVDLVVMQVHPDWSFTITERIKDLYRSGVPAYPEGYRGYFECADPSRGVVVDWMETELINPKCRR